MLGLILILEASSVLRFSVRLALKAPFKSLVSASKDIIEFERSFAAIYSSQLPPTSPLDSLIRRNLSESVMDRDDKWLTIPELVRKEEAAKEKVNLTLLYLRNFPNRSASIVQMRNMGKTQLFLVDAKAGELLMINEKFPDLLPPNDGKPYYHRYKREWDTMGNFKVTKESIIIAATTKFWDYFHPFDLGDICKANYPNLQTVRDSLISRFYERFLANHTNQTLEGSRITDWNKLDSLGFSIAVIGFEESEEDSRLINLKKSISSTIA